LKNKEEKEEITALRELLKAGDTVYTIVTHVSRSGMMRHIRCITMRNNEPLDISYMVAKVLHWKITDDGVKVEGCGMDMGFHMIHNLGYALFPNGFQCTGQKCPSNDHFNGDRNYESHLHKEGGYALIQRWL